MRAAGFVDNRSVAAAQLAGIVQGSSRVTTQRAYADGIRHSPRMTAQRAQLESIGGATQQRHAPVQGKFHAGATGTVAQRYPVIHDGTEFVSNSGRPNGHSNAGTKDAIIDEIFALSAGRNSFEVALRKMSKSNAKAALRATWLSDNGCAICHKLAISHIEDAIVAAANLPNVSKTAAASFLLWVNNLFPTDPLGLKASADALAQKINKKTANGQDISDLIALIDRSPDNLYIGDSPTNSGIGANFDPNFDLSDPTDVNEAPYSPRTEDIYDGDHDFGPYIGQTPLSPIRETDNSGDTYVRSSGAFGYVFSNK
jgi:hypothetical protein